MKIKKSFVTNSSTTSFVGFGISYNGEMNETLRNNIKKAYSEKYNKELSDAEIDDDRNDCIGYVLPKKFDMVSAEWGNPYVGCEYTSMPADMTKKQFHEWVEKTLKDLGFDTSTIGVISEAWYDG